MADRYVIKSETLTAIADAIRTNTDVTTIALTPVNMPSKITEVRQADYDKGYDEGYEMGHKAGADGLFTDLTGASCYIPSGWSYTGDSVEYAINGTIQITGGAEYEIDGIKLSTSGFGYHIPNDTGYMTFSNSYGIRLNITDGADVTNPELIYWINQNGVISGVDVYGEGYNYGYSIGYDTGYEEGHRAAYSEGYDTGYEEGHSAGYDEGETDGYNRGKTDGYNNGYFEGNQAGYDKGHSIGYNEGYTDGYDEAWASSGVDDMFVLMTVQAKNLPVDAAEYNNGEEDYMYPIELFEPVQIGHEGVMWLDYIDYDAVGSSSTMDLMVINHTDRHFYIYVQADCEFDDAQSEHKYERFYQRMYLEPQESYALRINATAGGINYSWETLVTGLRFI